MLLVQISMNCRQSFHTDPSPRKVTGPRQLSRVFDPRTRLISNAAGDDGGEDEYKLYKR